MKGWFHQNLIRDVIPEKAGIHLGPMLAQGNWMPAFAGMTVVKQEIFEGVA
ncbi:MAG: hypothetical protein L6Q71_11690 [Planctomycetes bacterium]|nr:hypothetical protein [Planctomycetota bacterium]NUQ33450.1 hypothetical protein [Planctomycetaceae bacterium]